MKNNMLLTKSKQIDLCGVIGMALAFIGLLLPSLRVSYMGMGVSATMFEATWWTVLPLLLILGTCALYAMRYEVMGFLGAVVSALVYFIVLVICRAVGLGGAGSYGVSVHYTIGFYIAFLGFAIAIAAPWINGLVFKSQAKPAADRQPQADPYMNRQPQADPYMNQQPQAAPYMNQVQDQAVNNAGQTLDQAGQFVQNANDPELNKDQQ